MLYILLYVMWADFLKILDKGFKIKTNTKILKISK